MKQVAYKGPRENQEVTVGDLVYVIDRSDFAKGGHVHWVEVTNEVADSLNEEEWSVRDTPTKKRGGDSA